MADPKQYLPSTEIVVRDFRIALLWPLRLEPSGSLKTERESTNRGASEWIRAYADWITGEGKIWEIIDDFYVDSGGEALNPEQRYAQFLYFHPFIQRCFYGRRRAATDKQTTGGDYISPVAVLKRTDITEVQICLRPKEGIWRCPVDRMNLFLFPTDVGVATVELGMPQSEGADRPFHLSDAMDFLDWVRRVYPPYFSADKVPGGVPAYMEWLPAKDGEASDFQCFDTYMRATSERFAPVANHWKALMKPLSPHSHIDSGIGLRYSQLEDDRLPVIAYIAVDQPASISPQDQARLAFCDAHDNDPQKWPCSDTFLKDFERENCYDRFWDPEHGLTTRYLVTGYSFLALGRRGDWFFDTHVPNHVLHIYFLLGVLAHVQKASLLGFWRRLAEMVHVFEQAEASRASREKLFRDQEWLLQDLTDFTSRFYFREVSNQLQALELFDLMSKQLRIQPLFEDVLEQSEFVRRVLFEERQQEISSLANRWLPVSLAAMCLGLSVGLGRAEDLLFYWVTKWVSTGWVTLIDSLVAAAVFLLTWALFDCLVSRVRGKSGS